MIDFELSPQLQFLRQAVHALAENSLRPIAREYDDQSFPCGCSPGSV